ncbi:MAG TPA: helix-turn-helix domain-containing protein [Terriglobia bacterium]|nr:helix-turn-helix domain-containing protein [Terriglobia bacterium]
MPRIRAQWPANCSAELLAEQKRTQTKEQHRRVLCLLLREVAHLKPAQIAKVLGLSTSGVRRVQALYANEGKAMFERPGRGGAHHRNLTEPEEREMLEEVITAALPGCTVGFPKIQEAYERRAGHPVSASVVWRMLRRQGWRTASLDTIMAARGWAASRVHFELPAWRQR